MRQHTGVGAGDQGVQCVHCGGFAEDPWDPSPEGFTFVPEWHAHYHDECLQQIASSEQDEDIIKIIATVVD